MCDNLEAVVQRTVVLAVGQRFRLIGDVHQRLRAAVAFTAVIDFQLYAEIARAFAAEDGEGLEVVIVDGAVLDGSAAIGTVGIVVVQRIPAVVGVDDAPAADASGVVPVIAFGADGEVIVLTAVVGAQETAAAVGADKGQVVQTIGTVEPAVELGKLSFGSTTVGTGAEFGHSKIPPKYKISLRGSPGGLHLYSIYLEGGEKPESVPHPIDADNTSPVYRSMITVAYTEPVGLPPPIQYSTSVVAVTTLPL